MRTPGTRPFSARIALSDGAKDSLDALKAAGAKLAVVSNNIWPQRFLEEELQRLGIADYFDYVIASSKHGVKKPHAPIFEDTLKALGVAEDEAVFVGDSLREDVVGPSMVGMRTVYVGTKKRDHARCNARRDHRLARRTPRRA